MTRPQVVGDIMTPRVMCLLEEENLESVSRGMKRFRFRHLPVVDDNKLVGIVSERDYLRASVSAHDPDRALKEDNLERFLFVAEIMTRDVVSVRPTTPLAEAGRLLREHKFGCLPVTEEDGTLVGIVTDSDFLVLALRLLEPER
jgi:CBS domain-containing membrane protein